MSRLTADELVDLDRWAADDLRGDEQRQVWAATDELRERRAADLKPEEVEALKWVRGLDALDTTGYEPCDAAIAIRVRDLLDRLIDAGSQ